MAGRGPAGQRPKSDRHAAAASMAYHPSLTASVLGTK